MDTLPAMNSTSKPYRLRLPGPTAVPERVRFALAQPVYNHRGPEFRSVQARAEELAKPILGTANHVLFFASSGTGAMEASLVNILTPGQRVLVIVNGQFGERFVSIAKALGARVDLLEVPWGQAVETDAVERKLAEADYRAVVAVHNESSTGIATNLAEIGSLLRDRPALFVVDSVSGLGGLEMRQDEWGVDIVASASQKSLMCPPGVAILSISPKAWAVVVQENGLPRFYWDFRKAMASAEKFETPFTSPVSLITGLKEALEMIHEEGLSEVLARHKRLSGALRAGCVALGLPCFGQADSLSPTVVVLQVPEPLNGGDIVRRLYEKHRTVIAGARNKLSGKVIRFGTMGYLHEADILTDLMHLEDVLKDLGWKYSNSASVAAAATFWSS
jgi:aspartate aminotransferase-like enzyme